jgi:hypothetical protein
MKLFHKGNGIDQTLLKAYVMYNDHSFAICMLSTPPKSELQSGRGKWGSSLPQTLSKKDRFISLE